jgi:hypothetical protein
MINELTHWWSRKLMQSAETEITPKIWDLTEEIQVGKYFKMMKTTLGQNEYNKR